MSGLLGTFLHFGISIAALLIAVVIHELAHGWVAYKLGDNTAKATGRLSFNPIKHADLFGSFLLPLMLLLSGSGFVLGWAKPVPVNFNRLHHPRRDLFLVSAAGICANFLLAGVCGVFIRLLAHLSIPGLTPVLLMFLFYLININIILAVFNLLPIPPLDGSKIFFGWINRPWAQEYITADRQGLLAIISLAIFLPYLGQMLNLNLNFLSLYLKYGYSFLVNLIL